MWLTLISPFPDWFLPALFLRNWKVHLRSEKSVESPKLCSLLKSIILSRGADMSFIPNSEHLNAVSHWHRYSCIGVQFLVNKIDYFQVYIKDYSSQFFMINITPIKIQKSFGVCSIFSIIIFGWKPAWKLNLWKLSGKFSDEPMIQRQTIDSHKIKKERLGNFISNYGIKILCFLHNIKPRHHRGVWLDKNFK